MLTSFIIGFSLGLAGSLVNHWLSLRSLKKLDKNSPTIKIKRGFTGDFILRQFINVFVLFLVRKDVTMLVAAAIGLTMVKNYLLVYYTLGRKGVR
ncbi:MAG: hypothetical protein GXW85_02355 [Clostridia bacterium]|nr:hypothetical protein [Clostridia bacterium]